MRKLLPLVLLLLTGCIKPVKQKTPIIDKITTPNSVMINYLPSSGTSPLTVNFTAVCQPCVAYVWSFGDNTFSSTHSLAQQHTYTVAGNYQAQFSGTDVNGVPYIGTVPVSVNPGDIVTASIKLISTGNAPYPTLFYPNTFVMNASSSEGVLTSVQWNCGWGVVPSLLQFSYNPPAQGITITGVRSYTGAVPQACEYTFPGTYNVSATVTDNLGQSAVAKYAIVIKP